MRPSFACLASLLWLWSAAACAAQARPDGGCGAAIAAAEAGSRLPPGLLGSIAVVESGLPGPGGRPEPWPWTIDVAGAGAFFETKAEAIAAVQAAQARGVRSIDVGCMQINLQQHPDAFASLDEAFDPQANAAYAAGFLMRLYQVAGSWPEAAASYHSSTPGLREDYQRRVMISWPAASRYGATASMLSPAAWPGTAGRLLAGTRGTSTARTTVDRLAAPALRTQLAQRAADHGRWAAMGLVPTLARMSAAVRLASLPRHGRPWSTMRD